MNHEGLAGDLLGMDAGRVGEPVVGVNHVEFLSAGYHAGANRVIVDFFQEIVGISAGELDASEIIQAHVVEVGIDMVAQTEILVRVHDVAYAAFHIFAAYVTPCHRDL